MKISILLVEDSPSDIRLTEEALKRSKLEYSLDIVNDGVEAMEYLESKKAGESLPDIILLDLNMPRKNGHEVLAEVKEDERLRKIPVIVLTVSQRDEDVMEALSLKMNYYLAKPISSQSIADLVSAIHALETKGSDAAAHESDEQTHIRMVLGGNPHSSDMVLDKLASDESERVRARVAGNNKAPQSVLEKLADDDCTEVRISLSENENVSESILRKLAKDESEDVRLAVSGNPNVPQDILKELQQDENVFVAQQAEKTLSKA